MIVYHRQGNKLSDEYAGKGALLHQIPDGVVTEIDEIDTMAYKVLHRLMDINMACAREFPNTTRRSRVDRSIGAIARTKGPQSIARQKLEELGHEIALSGATLRCTRCLCRRPLHETKAWVLEGQCPGPPASSASGETPRPPTAQQAAPRRYGRGTVHPSHRTTLIRGLLFCWGCGGFHD